MSEFLSRALVKLESAWALLDELKVPSVGGCDNAGKPPARRRSAPPVRLAVLSVDCEITGLAREVFANVAADVDCPLPAGGVAVWCRWCRGLGDRVDTLPWCDDLVDEVLGWLAWVEQVTGADAGVYPRGDYARIAS